MELFRKNFAQDFLWLKCSALRIQPILFFNILVQFRKKRMKGYLQSPLLLRVQASLWWLLSRDKAKHGIWITHGFILKTIQWHIHAGSWSLVNCWREALTRHYIRCSWILMNAAVGLMDGLGLDGDRCIRVIPRQLWWINKIHWQLIV